jgi:hypothetical protein
MQSSRTAISNIICILHYVHFHINLNVFLTSVYTHSILNELEIELQLKDDIFKYPCVIL